MHGRRLRLLAAVAETTLRRDLRPVEHGALDAALTLAERDPVPTIPHVLTALQDPDDGAARADGTSAVERAAEGRDLAHALRRLVRGDLAGMFDGPSTHPLDPGAPMVVLDLSRLGSHDDALALAMTCASAWLEAALAAPGSGLRWVIYDEAWRLLRSVPLVRRMQAQWKLSRAHGIANLLILHRLVRPRRRRRRRVAGPRHRRGPARGLLHPGRLPAGDRPADRHRGGPRPARHRAGPAARAAAGHRAVGHAGRRASWFITACIRTSWPCSTPTPPCGRTPLVPL